MARSKYTSFWQDRFEILKSAVDFVLSLGKMLRVPCQAIEKYGQRNNWHGTVVVGDKKIINGGEMAHMKALGILIAPYTQKYPGQQIRFSMDNLRVLTVKLERETAKPPRNPEISIQDEITNIPKDCQMLHIFAWSLERYRYPLASGLPKNGVYFCFEEGEKAHGGERIVRVGINRDEGNLPTRINDHYSGNMENSIFRKHVGRALAKKYSHEIPEEKISEYIRNKISFGVEQVDSRKGRKQLEADALETLSTCRECGPSDQWLGNYSPNHTIRASGLWNVQGVKVHDTNQYSNRSISTLILIPCCASKLSHNKSSFLPTEQDSIYNHLSSEAGAYLKNGREYVKELANIDPDSTPVTSLDIYYGHLYRVPGFRDTVKNILKTGSCHVGIISGGYGIVLPNELIQEYDCCLETTYSRWLKAKLTFVISDFAVQLGVKQVIGFLALTSPYFKVIREVDWENSGAELVRCYYPQTDDVLGLMAKVPRFLGAAAKQLMENRCDLDSLEDFSSEGMEIGWEDMM